MKQLIKRLFCKHGPWVLLAIEWDGAAVVKCDKCGKLKRVAPW